MPWRRSSRAAFFVAQGRNAIPSIAFRPWNWTLAQVTMEIAMSEEIKKPSYRIDAAHNGHFALVQTHPDRPEKVIGHHPTREAARGWLVNHLTATMDGLTMRPG
jgi:hypothetical protein